MEGDPMSLREQWINVIYRVATGSARLRAALAPFLALIFFSLITLLAWLCYRLDRWLDWPQVPPYPFNIVVAIPIFAAGIPLVLWCVMRFLKARGTPVPLSPPQELVTTGPYAVTRNPMLTGLFTVLFGIGVWLSSIGVMFICTPLLILLNVLELKFIEEPELEKRLGAPYIEYKKRIPMFVQRLRRGHNGNGGKLS
jgi:protein-S-isoprenylcysteine O-methyltransferase Ste14